MFHYLHVMGAEGAYFQDYGLVPGHQSGRYKLHLNKMLPGTCPTARVCVPSYVRGRANHTSRNIPFMLTYASICKEMDLNPDVVELLENGDYDNPSSPLNLPCYKDNILTKTCGHYG